MNASDQGFILCTDCGVEKPLSDFGQRRNRGKYVYRTTYCRPCTNQRHKEWRKNNREQLQRTRRVSELKNRYGLTPAQYDEMLKAQGGGCAICGKKPTTKKRLGVDHDHTTGKVRGILCDQCNHAVGLLGDDPDRMMAAAAYLLQAEEVACERI